MTKSNSKITEGEDVLRDAAKLLDDLEFDSIRGGIARNEQIFISVTPDWHDDTRQFFQAAVTCHATWHREVSWQLLRISARPKDTSGFFVQHVLPLSDRGIAIFEDLAPGSYVLRAYSNLVRFTTPQAGVAGHDDITSIGTGVAMGEDPSNEPEARPLIRGESQNDEITILVSNRKASVSIEFATNDDQLAGKSLEFCASNPETREIYADAVAVAFSRSAAEGEFRYQTPPVELSFSAGDDVEVSYRVL